MASQIVVAGVDALHLDKDGKLITEAENMLSTKLSHKELDKWMAQIDRFDEALEVSRRLAREEGILCGITAGTNVAAALKMAKVLGPGKTIVTILPDTGERYFSTELFLEK